MNAQRALMFGITGIVAVGVVAGAFATIATAATSGYAVKVRVTDKIQSANIFEGIVLEQAKGKTNILGDQVNFRVLGSTTATNKSSKKQSTKNWLSSLKIEDRVTAVGNYKKADNTFEVVRMVNRSR